jgi:tetratricopeptide (TPR) repeat protein
MSTCKSCGTELNNTAKFCPACGAKVIAGPAFCANCGQPLIPGAKFCAFCGTGIASEPSVAAGKNEIVKTKLMEKAGELLRSSGSAQDPFAKKVAAAIDIYTKIIEQDESCPHVWTQRGFAKLLGVRYFDAEYLDGTFENYKVALPDLDRAIEEDEEDGDAYAYRAEIRWHCGQTAGALEDLQRAFDLSADGWVVTADEMHGDGVELPQEILDGLRDEGYIDNDEEEE